MNETQEAREAWTMAVNNLGLVRFHAQRMHSVDDFEEAVQDGAIGLFGACKAYDPTRGFKLSSAATPWIRQAILRGAISRRGGKNARRQYKSGAGLTGEDRPKWEFPLSLDYDYTNAEGGVTGMEAFIADPTTDTPEAVAEVEWLRKATLKECHDERDRVIVNSLFDGVENLAAIARVLGITRAAVAVRATRLRAVVRRLMGDDYGMAA